MLLAVDVQANEAAVTTFENFVGRGVHKLQICSNGAVLQVDVALLCSRRDVRDYDLPN